MDVVVCNQCNQANPALRSVCKECGAILAQDLQPNASMPRPTTHLASQTPMTLAGSETKLGIVTFADHASWLIQPQPVTTIETLPDLRAGGTTNLGSALDLVGQRAGARIVISDLHVTQGRSWDECLMQVRAEHQHKVRWGVVGIREPRRSWNPHSRDAASHPHLYQESRYDAGLAKALLHISQTILEAHQTTELNVLLDTSGSMREGTKWQAAREALAALIYELREDALRPTTRLLTRWQA